MDLSADIYLTIISATIILLCLLATIISLLFMYQNRQLHNRVEMKRVKDTYENEILKTRLEIKEQTLKNISQDIHDNVGQILSLANLTLSSLDLPEDDVMRNKVTGIMGLISKSIADLRNLSRTLDPDNIARQGLVACLQFELSLLEKTGMFTTRLSTCGTEPALDASHQLLIYRIVQEAINNVIKHSKATAVDIMVSFDKTLVLSIEDNGIGFEPSVASALNGGAGLRNMTSRTRLMHGDFAIENLPTKGTKITLAIPLTETPHDHEKN